MPIGDRGDHFPFSCIFLLVQLARYAVVFVVKSEVIWTIVLFPARIVYEIVLINFPGNILVN